MPSQAVLRMRDDVDALATTEVDPERAIQAGTLTTWPTTWRT